MSQGLSVAKLLKKTLFAAALVLFFLALGAQSTQAKDLANRLGLGYKNQFSEDLPSIAAQYYPSSELGVSASLGVDTADENSKFGFMVRLNKIVFMEDNHHFYMGAGAGLLSAENAAGQNESGFELAGFAGCEFFLTGLDSLGFSFETGAAVTSVSSGTRFRTMADSPVRAGMFFYF